MTIRHSKKSPGVVRITGGVWRQSSLAVPTVPGLRPSPIRLRETLFNWLGQDLSGWVCADVFAGTGALGLEAASRGASQVWLFETNSLARKALQASIDKLKATQVVLCAIDGVRGMAQLPDSSLDLVLLDPPFAQNLHLVALSACRPKLKSQAWIYLESDQAWSQAQLEPQGLALWRSARAGQVYAHLMQPIA